MPDYTFTLLQLVQSSRGWRVIRVQRIFDRLINGLQSLRGQGNLYLRSLVICGSISEKNRSLLLLLILILFLFVILLSS